MDEKGVYAVARSIWDDADFAGEPFTEREAWMWLISKASWKDGKVRGNNGSPVDLKRGELSIAVRFMAKKWLWTKDKAHRFLKKLQKRDIIRDASRDGHSIYSINKYNEFQVVGLPKRDAESDKTATAARQQRDKEETLKHSNIKPEEQDVPAKAVALVPGNLPDWLPLEAWRAYLAMRKAKKASPTPETVILLVAKLDRWRKLGHDPTEILNASTESNWTGIFEPKGSNGKRTNGPSSHDKFLSAAASFIGDQFDGTPEDGDGGTAPRQIGGPLLPP